jgi:hypothetical protein
MQNKVNRIIIDTNLWISFLITKDFTKLDEIIFSRHGILVFSQELLDEFLEVARRPKFRRFFSASNIEEILETIDEYANFVKVHTKIEICRDTKDNFLLSLSIDGNANFINGRQRFIRLGQIWRDIHCYNFGIPARQIIA